MISISFPNEATALGSTAYYVCRFSNQQFQDNLAALFFWKHELNRLYTLSDPGIARIKLQWWLQQIGLPPDTSSAHPLAKKLGQIYHASQTAAVAFEAVHAEIDRHLHRQPYQDIHAFLQGCMTMGENFSALILQATEQDATAKDFHMGCWIIFTEWLQNLGATSRQNIHLLPESLLRAHQLNDEKLLQTEQQLRVQSMLFDLLKQLESMLEKPVVQRGKTPLHKYYRLRMKLLELLIDDKLAVMQQRISLTPVRKLWYAL
jgi:phytoene synthase